jgi:hypothetical protein
MSVRYVFIRVEGNKAVLEISTIEATPEGTPEPERSEVLVNERYCQKLYEDACRNTDNQIPDSPSFESRADLRKAFYAIHASKRSRRVPIDVKDLE